MLGDSANVFLHCGDVSAPDVDASSVIKVNDMHRVYLALKTRIQHLRTAQYQSITKP